MKKGQIMTIWLYKINYKYIKKSSMDLYLWKGVWNKASIFRNHVILIIFFSQTHIKSSYLCNRNMAIDTTPSIKDEPKKRLLESRAPRSLVNKKKSKAASANFNDSNKRHLPKNDALLIMCVCLLWNCTIHTLLHPFK